MGKKFVSEDKDRERLKAQRETIIKLEREIKLLKQQIRSLEKALNRPEVPEEKKSPEPPKKKLSPEEEREATRKKFAEWNKSRSSTSE